MRQAVWTDEAISRLFTYLNSHGNTYFSENVGRQIIRYVSPHLSGVTEVLDYGCGPGYLTEYLLQAGYKATAMDFTDSSVRETKERCGKYKSFKGVYSYSELSTLESKYDAVFVLEVIEHLSDYYLDDLMNNMKKYCKKNGYLVITTPNNENLQEGMSYCPFCDTEFHHVQHMRSWNASTLTVCLDKYGFDVVFIDAVSASELYLPCKRKIINIIKAVWRKINKVTIENNKPNLICVAQYRG